MRVCIFFRNFGPYHVARIRALSTLCSLLPIEISATSSDYQWGSGEHESYARTTLITSEKQGSVRHSVVRERLVRALHQLKPEVLAVPGWWDLSSLTAIQWAAGAGVPVVMMSESGRNDEPRQGHREYVKRQLIRVCSAAIVGGTPHRRYIQDLGMDPSRVVDGYDVVDNQHFSRGAAAARNNMEKTRKDLGLPDNYFLASSRFLPRKNLLRLISAYELYRRQVDPGNAWSLVILGYGKQEQEIRNEVAQRSLQPFVQLAGFQPYDRLPAYYALAGAFIHPATSEPWGLVVNEAMASGIVPIVSTACGCAPDLVTDNVTGFQFDPGNAEQLSHFMFRIASEPGLRTRLGKNAEIRIAEWSPDRFAKNFMRAAAIALGRSSRPVPLVSRACLWSLLHRAS